MSAFGAIEPLEWTFPPKPGEPAAGYGSRLAALNGVGFAAFMSNCGISVYEVHSGIERGVRQVAMLGGLDDAMSNALAANTPVRPSRLRPGRLGNERLLLGAILSGFFRFCPHCMAQDIVDTPQDVPVAARPWLRLAWSINQVRSCSTHGVRLFETRRIPGKVVDFSSTVATEVLPNLDRLRSETMAVAPNEFEGWVQRRLRQVREPSNWLDTMPLNAAVSACESLGVEGLGPDRPHLSKLSNAEWAEISLTGYRIACKGETSISSFLDTLVVRNHSVGLIGAKSVYGHVLEVLDGSLADSGFEALRNVVRRHAFENVPLPPGAHLLGEVLKERRLHTATTAAAASNCTTPTLRAIFARSGIAPPSWGPDRQRLTIRVDAFDAQLREFGAALKLNDIRAEIGIPHKHLLELIARGTIPTVFGSREVHKARHRVTRGDIEAFMDRLSAGAVPVETPTERQVTFGRACLIASTNIGDLVDLLLAGKLAWKGSRQGGRKYVDLLVDADEVVRVLQAGEPARRGLTKVEIGKEWPGLRRDVVEALVRAGHLRVEKEFCPATRRKLLLVTHESYAAFTSRYRTVTDMCRGADRDARAVKRRLANAGITPAFDEIAMGNTIYEMTKAVGIILAECPPRGAIWAISHRKMPRRISTQRDP